MFSATYNMQTNLNATKKIKPPADNVFRIFIQRSFKQVYIIFVSNHYLFKVIDLPAPTIWRDALLQTFHSRLMIQIIRYGFFFNNESDYLPLRCILTRRGYLIIYTKETSLQGYALKLSNGKKMQITSWNKEKVCRYFFKEL